jgi:hypothetical protein
LHPNRGHGWWNDYFKPQGCSTRQFDLVNILSFILCVIGASTLGPTALKFDFWYYGGLAILPGPLCGLHSLWGTYAVRYKSIFALNVYKYMSFVCLCVLGLFAFSCFTLATTDFNYLTERATDSEINQLMLNIYKAEDKCPSFRLDCRTALAWKAHTHLIVCGMFAVMNASLLALCAFAAWHLHSEKSAVETLLEELQKHPSHKNVNAFILAKKLCESRSMDKMAFADEGGGENAKQREYAKQRLKTMFRGYRLKTRGSAGANHTPVRNPMEPMEIER